MAETEWLKQVDSQVLQMAVGQLDDAYQRFEIDGSRIDLPKVGQVRAVFHRPLEGELKKCTVTKTKFGKYFISIQVEL